MKKTILALLLLSSTAMFAQNGRTTRDRNQPANHAPVTVQQSFQKDNPEVNGARWSQSNNQWKANYRDNNNRNVDAYYDRQGNRKATHRALDKMDVPRNVHDRVNGRYSANGNYEVARIERPNEQPIFQVKIHSGGRSRTVYMDEQGRNKPYHDHN